MEMRRIAVGLIACLGVAVLAAGCDLFGSDREFAPLEFPFGNPTVVVRMAAFGIPNWSGADPHNGIDLILSDTCVRTRIVSPTAGEISSIRMSENPYSTPVGQLILTVAIKVNDEWEVNLVFEPGTAAPVTKEAQRNAIRVSEGQEITAGTEIGDLLVGELGYPHLHYMVTRGGDAVCAYDNSSEAAKAIFEGIAALPGSNVPGGQICVR
jgi:murein DD-endopeptidase MepM/ murein hydrolase activator NlpD